MLIDFRTTGPKRQCNCRLGPGGQVGSGQVAAPPRLRPCYLLHVHGVTCLSNLRHLSLFHPAPPILETSSSTSELHSPRVLSASVGFHHSPGRYLRLVCLRCCWTRTLLGLLLQSLPLYPLILPLRPLSAAPLALSPPVV